MWGGKRQRKRWSVLVWSDAIRVVALRGARENLLCLLHITVIRMLWMTDGVLGREENRLPCEEDDAGVTWTWPIVKFFPATTLHVSVTVTKKDWSEVNKVVIGVPNLIVCLHLLDDILLLHCQLGIALKCVVVAGLCKVHLCNSYQLLSLPQRRCAM